MYTLLLFSFSHQYKVTEILNNAADYRGDPLTDCVFVVGIEETETNTVEKCHS